MKALIVSVVFCGWVLSAHAQDELKFDVPKLCRESMNTSFMEINQKVWKFPEELFQKDPKIIAAAFFTRPDRVVLPWRMQNLAQPKVLTAAVHVQEALAQRLVDRFHKGVSPREILRRAAERPAQYSQAAQSHAEKVLESIRMSKPADMGPLLKNAKLICAQYLDLKCSAAVAEIAKAMDTRWVGNDYFGPCCVGISLPATVRRVLMDPEIQQGLAVFVGRVMDVLSGRGRVALTDLRSDLETSYRSVGIPAEKARGLARTVLAFYGTRGASLAFFENAMNAENFPVMVSMYLFSVALGPLDLARSAQGLTYSYPPEVKSSCLMGRPYHFWMAHELVEVLRERGFSRRSSVIGAHIAGKLYEFGAEVLGRDPMRIYKDKFFNPYNVGVQVGLSYRTASVLHAGGFWKEDWRVDEGLEKIFKRAKPMPKLTPQQLEQGLKSQAVRYVWFHRVIAPDEFLRSTGLIPVEE